MIELPLGLGLRAEDPLHLERTDIARQRIHAAGVELTSWFRVGLRPHCCTGCCGASRSGRGRRMRCARAADRSCWLARRTVAQLQGLFRVGGDVDLAQVAEIARSEGGVEPIALQNGQLVARQIYA